MEGGRGREGRDKMEGCGGESEAEGQTEGARNRESVMQSESVYERAGGAGAERKCVICCEAAADSD